MIDSPTAAKIAVIIDRSGLTQREIANAVGWDRPNIVSMIRTGEMKIPIGRIPAFCSSCDADPVELIKIAMMEYHPEAWKVLVAAFDEPVTKSEAVIIRAIRAMAKGHSLDFRPDA